MAGRLGCTAESAPLVWDENGKPGVEGDPFYVSVSHSGPYVVAAAGDHVLGVDVEVIRGAEEKFMRRGLLRDGDGLHPLRRRGCFSGSGSAGRAKEALFKLTGKGPLLALSRLQLPEGVALDHIMQNGCAVTAAMQL